MLTAIGFLFLDFRGSLSASWFQTFTWLQFVPSLTKFLQTLVHGLAVTAYGFVVVLILTLFFGRVYCSYICPLGIFQDVISWFSKKILGIGKNKFRFRFSSPKTWLRYSILVVVCLSLFTSSIYLINLLDPYSNFGRFASDLFRPIYIMGNNLLVKLFVAFGSYALYPVDIIKADPFVLIVPIVMLVVVILLSVKKGRLYCNTICPVGTLLGLVSKMSLYKIRFDTSGCNQCGKCMFVCKSQCIDIKKQKVDFTRCVGCGNCMRSCDKNAIYYSLRQEPKGKLPNSKTDVSKRRFIFGSTIFIVALSGLSLKSFAQPLTRRIRNHRRRKRNETQGELGSGKGNREVIASNPVTPPGSVSQHHFTRACTACHLCVSACPTGVLQPSLFEYGFFGMMQPFMDYDVNFCNYECTRCTEICPNGAILSLTKEEKLTTQIGVVHFEKNN